MVNHTIEEVTMPANTKPYAKGAYNKMSDTEQWIRISEGCPNSCAFCRETSENGSGEIYFPLPSIERNKVKIMDMNLTCKSRFIEIADHLGAKKVDNRVVYYELICGIDYRYMTQEKADALKRNRFVNIRLAWDHSYLEQKRIKAAIEMLKRVGYGKGDISVFIICNWKRSFAENIKKVDLCKVWNVKVNDCYYDNQLPPNIEPVYWTLQEIKNFRKLCRKHNHLVNFGIDPEVDCDQGELWNTKK
jgi:hypothetical protein